MKGLRNLLPVVFALGFMASSAFAANPLGEKDFEAIQEFINTKRMITVEEKGGCLTISGDIRAEYQHLCEGANGVDLRGSGSAHQTHNDFNSHTGTAVALPVPTNEFDSQLNLMFDYQGCNTWAHAQLRFDNNAGVDKFLCCGSGVCNNVCLYKAYFGYNLFEECCSRLDLEVGRRRLAHAFDSRVQFASRFDGVLLRYSNSFECVGDFYVKAASFVVDENTNHFGYVGEVGFLNIMESGLDLKYSYIDWSRSGPSCYASHQPEGEVNAPEFQFRISQWTAAYNFHPEILRCDAKLYAAFLMNHDAKKRTVTHNQKADIAWYVGVQMGGLRQEGDWSADLNYQYVEAQAIRDCDVCGIGRGNVLKQDFYTHQAGSTNYQGWQFEGGYALTDNLSLTTELEYSQEVEKMMGGDHKFSKYKLELVYAF